MAPTLVHLLYDSVNRTPDAEAIIHEEQRVTYGRLWQDVSAVAAYLREHGFAAGQRVGILLENSPAYVAAYYGTLAAGGVAIGLNTAAKARDLVNWLRHSGTSWLFADAHHAELPELIQACGNGLRLVIVGDDSDVVHEGHLASWDEVTTAEAAAPDLAAIADGEQPAAIIYTSGTTGKPKGVTLSHRNLVSNVRSILAYLDLTAGDRILNVLPFYYSYGNSVLHTHLAVGGSLVLENSLMYPHKVLTAMSAEKVTGFSGVPSTFALLMNRADLGDYDLSVIRYMTQAGGAMAAANIARLQEVLPHIEFFVMYGQTEATARLAYLPPSMLQTKLGSVGIGIPGVTLEVRDEAGRVVAPGEVGEIYAKGDNIMLGYWNDPETTREVLHDGWLKTGDLGRVDEDGYLYIVGRSSEMIKTGAHRVSPKDIEEVIAELDGVEEVAVVSVPDPVLGQVIKAAIVRARNSTLDVRTVQAHCRKNLAMYKIPKHVEFVAELPKTASGKVKRYLLQEAREK
jgi:long-chain acyl-CoA synthetase